MISSLALESVLEFLDFIFHSIFVSDPTVNLVTKLSTYLPLLNQYIANVYFFFPKELFVSFVGIAFGFLFARIILAIINLIWW